MQPNQKIFYIEYFFAILIKHIYVSTANSLVKHSDQSRPIFKLIVFSANWSWLKLRHFKIRFNAAPLKTPKRRETLIH